MVFTELIAALLAFVLFTTTGAAPSTAQPEGQGALDDDVTPFLLVAAWGSILRIEINGSTDAQVIHSDNGIIAVDYHYRRNLIFYIKDSTPGLFSIPLLTDAGATGAVAAQSLRASQILSGSPIDLAVDWINDKVYWTDKTRRTLNMYDIEAQTSEVIFQFEGSDQPQGLSIFPYTGKGWLFVMVKTDIYNSKLMRITDNGASKTLLPNNLCASTNTIDLIKRKLYWIDECNSLLEEAELDASSPKTMAGPGQNVGFSWGLGQYGDECYYTQTEKVFRNGINSNATQLYTNGLYKTLYGLVVVHPSKQPLASDLVEIGPDTCHPSCGNGVCVPPGTCSCQPGWTGETCNQAVDTTQAPQTTTTTKEPTTLSPTTQPPTTIKMSPTTQTSTTQPSTTTQTSTILATDPEPATEISSTVSSSPTTTSTSSVPSTLAATTLTTTESKPTTSVPLVKEVSSTEPTTTTNPEVATTRPGDSTNAEVATTGPGGSTTLPTMRPVGGLEAMPEGARPSSMALIIIAVCTVVFLLILVFSGGYVFLVIFRYHRRRRGSYDVRKRRRESALLSPTSPNSNYRGFTEYYPTVFAGVSEQPSRQGTITGSLSVDSFERMSIGSPLVDVVVPCTVQMAAGAQPVAADQPVAAGAQPMESIRFEVTEAEIQPLAAATPEVVVVGTSDSDLATNRRQIENGTLYATEQTELYFSL